MSRSTKSSSAMLDHWRPPRSAGDPIGCLATSYTFDAGFFEEDCLARFLEIYSLPDREGLAYLLDRENRLGAVYVGALVDHTQAGVEHSLRWDVLPVRVPRGKQHSKVSLLAWTNHVRVIVSSANVTLPGYRSNFEVAGVVEFHRDRASHRLIQEVTGFLNGLIGLVPGLPGDAIRARAAAFVTQIGEQVQQWIDVPRGERSNGPAFAATFPGPADEGGRSSLQDCLAVAAKLGPAPVNAHVAAPFFDTAAGDGIDTTTAELCRRLGRSSKRRVHFAVPASGDSDSALRLAAPKSLLDTANRSDLEVEFSVLPQSDPDQNVRAWHAKMLRLSNSEYTMLMQGSSNFTKAGMGVGGVRNVEANLIYWVRHEAYSRAVGELENCWPETTSIEDLTNIEWCGPLQDQEEESAAIAAPVPLGFVSVQFRLQPRSELVFLFDPAHLPESWEILGGPSHDQRLLDSSEWTTTFRSEPQCTIAWSADGAPGRLLVRWGDKQAFWAINAEDHSQLPVPDEIRGMSYEDLLLILATSDPGAAFRLWARRQQVESSYDEELDSAVSPELDPLRRHDLSVTFLHRVRRQAGQLANLKAGLERPVWSEAALRWRLTGVIGIEQLVYRMLTKLQDPSAAADNVLMLADLMMTLADVRYPEGEAGLSRDQFQAIYRPFVANAGAMVDRAVNQVPELPAEILAFWRQVYQRSVE